MSEDKVVELERTRDADGQLGTFGFSILGGYGTKFPACVCEVDRGGPADQTNKVQGYTCVGIGCTCVGMECTCVGMGYTCVVWGYMCGYGVYMCG